jgi:hypothetical protein
VQQPVAAPYPAEPQRKRTGTIIAAIVIVVVVILALLFVLAVFQKQAIVEARVCSNHLLSTVTFTLSSNGNVIKSGTLSPLDCVTYTFTETWFGGDTKTVLYTAESEGGLFGTQSDSETVVLTQNANESISLYV